MTLCSATTTDRLSGCLTQCTLPKGHDGDHTDHCGMTWGFRAHDLDIDNSNSHISRLLRGHLPPPPTEEEIVARTRRETYREVLAKCGVDAAEDASTTTLLLQVDEVIGRLKTERDELLTAGRAVVDAFSGRGSVPCACGCGALATQFGRNDNVPVVDLDTCDKCADWLVNPGEFSYAPAWRTFCALIGANGR